MQACMQVEMRMYESNFKPIVKNWLKNRGYNLNYDYTIVIKKDDMRARELFDKAYNQLYIENKKYAITSWLFVKEFTGNPDIIAVKDGVVHIFEVKTDLGNEKLDRCLGQCLRYLMDSWIERINVVVPRGTKGVLFLNEIISNFKLPIKVIELDVGGLKTLFG